MKFLYCTDLHGDIDRYETVLKYLLKNKISILHLGADILPKGAGMLKTQKKFIKGYLKNFYAECERNGIKVLASFGNDDLYTRKKYFLKYAALLDDTPYRRSGYNFKAYSYVPDHPFSLKNGTKLDRYGLDLTPLRKKMVPVPVFLEAFLLGETGSIVKYIPKTPKAVDCTSGDGFQVIPDLKDYFKYKGSIEDDLHGIRAGSKTIMSIHSPPAGLNLDVCGLFKKRGKPKPRDRVGSEAVLRWIKDRQPLLVLCGHIHENYLVTGAWKATVGRTTIIQPGQNIVWKENQKKKTVFVVIEINGTKIKAKRFEI